MFLLNVVWISTDYTVLYTGRYNSSQSKSFNKIVLKFEIESIVFQGVYDPHKRVLNTVPSALSAEMLYLISHTFNSHAIGIVNVILTEGKCLLLYHTRTDTVNTKMHCNMFRLLHESYLIKQHKNVIKVNVALMWLPLHGAPVHRCQRLSINQVALAGKTDIHGRELPQGTIHSIACLLKRTKNNCENATFIYVYLLFRRFLEVKYPKRWIVFMRIW
jgi:hypothetical protein